MCIDRKIGPWTRTDETTDEDTPPFVPMAMGGSLGLNHSHSSSTHSLLDSRMEQTLLTDEF